MDTLICGVRSLSRELAVDSKSDTSDAAIEAILTEGGHLVSEWFIVLGQPCFRDSGGSLYDVIIEDEEVANATLDFLRRKGALEFSSFEEYKQHFPTF